MVRDEIKKINQKKNPKQMRTNQRNEIHNWKKDKYEENSEF